MDTKFEEEQGRIHREVAETLIGMTPETWKVILLEVERRPEGLALVIKSPEGHREQRVPPEQLYSAIFRLDDLFAQRGTPWRKVVYRVEENARGNWDFKANFEY